VHKGDRYFHVADFPSYVETQQIIGGDYLNEDAWWRKAVLNVARIGKFSSDRTILEYSHDIWHIGPFESKTRAVKVPARTVAPLKATAEAIAPSDPAPEAESKQVAD
jgi:hypothetical protein